MLVLEVGFDPLRRCLHHLHVFCGLLQESLPCPPRNACRDGVFQVCIQPFVRIQFRAVARLVEHLDSFLVLFEPFRHGFAVMHFEVVVHPNSPAPAPIASFTKTSLALQQEFRILKIL